MASIWGSSFIGKGEFYSLTALVASARNPISPKNTTSTPATSLWPSLPLLDTTLPQEVCCYSLRTTAKWFKACPIGLKPSCSETRR